MDYLEIEGKAQLERYGIRTNGGVILEGDEIPPEVTFPCVLKGQIQAGHRGQHGAVKVVKTPEELLKVKKDIEKITINGKHMEGIISTGFLPIAEEYYLGLTLDVKNREEWISKIWQQIHRRNCSALTAQQDSMRKHSVRQLPSLNCRQKDWIS